MSDSGGVTAAQDCSKPTETSGIALAFGLDGRARPRWTRKESQCKPTHGTGKLDDAAAEEKVTVVKTVASFFVSLEAAPGVQPGGGEEPAPHAPAPPWLSSFQNACNTSFGRNGCVIGHGQARQRDGQA